MACCVKNQNCTIDKLFKRKFNEKLQTLEEFSKGFSGDDTRKAVNAAYYLNVVTGIESSIYLGDVVYYEPKLFKKDKRKWKAWYKDNRCSMTIDKADSLLRAGGKGTSRVDELFKNVQKTNRQETQSLIHGLKGKHDKKAMQDYGIYAYQLTNGTAIVDWEDFGRLYPSMDEVYRVSQAIRDNSSKQPTSSHILNGIFHYDHNFPSESLKIAKELLTELNIDKFDFNLKSLKQVDEAVNKVLKKEASYETYSKLYPGLVAIVGHVLLNDIPNSRWKMYSPEGENIWEPYIENNKEQTFNPFLLVYKELYEYHFEEQEPVDLFSHVQIEMIQYQIKTK